MKTLEELGWLNAEIIADLEAKERVKKFIAAAAVCAWYVEEHEPPNTDTHDAAVCVYEFAKWMRKRHRK